MRCVSGAHFIRVHDRDEAAHEAAEDGHQQRLDQVIFR